MYVNFFAMPDLIRRFGTRLYCNSNRAFSSSNNRLTVAETLKDTHGRFHNYLRISLTERCNLRCQYCMPEEGVELTPSNDILTTPEVIRLVELFAKQGVTKVRLTGGEPLLRRDLLTITKNISNITGIRSVAMTTNGVTLWKHAKALKEVGLASINVSLDTLIPEKFEFISRRKGHNRVLEGIEECLSLGYSPLKINCVVMRGLNEEELVDFVALTENKCLDVRFIEYMPFDGNKWNTRKFLPYQEMLEIIRQKWPNLQRHVDSINDTTKHYIVPGFAGRVGFITSMSQNFCGSCNRIRLTADGNLKVCLFGQNEVSLRDCIRQGMTDNELLEVVSCAVKRKHPRHAGMINLSKQKNRPMILIGGFHSQSCAPEPVSNSCSVFNSSSNRLLHKAYSSLSHIDSQGDPKMVDVTNKSSSVRTAVAEGNITLTPEAIKLIIDPSTNPKGSVINVAKLAAIMAVKKTPDMIPLCHSGLGISGVDVEVMVNNETDLTVRVSVKSIGVTGVEMEALMGVATGLLTVYDMTKSVSHDHTIHNIRLVTKTGGKRDKISTDKS